MKYFVLVALLFATPAFAETPPADPFPVISADGSLYQAFGGHDGLVHITDDLMVNVLADPRTHDFFVAAKRDQIKSGLIQIFCHVMGGGCDYTGKNMTEAHSQLGIREEDFTALVENLQKAMDKNHVPFWAQNRLLAAMAPHHREIVTGAGKG
jgi:hemoglobin